MKAAVEGPFDRGLKAVLTGNVPVDSTAQRLRQLALTNPLSEKRRVSSTLSLKTNAGGPKVVFLFLLAALSGCFLPEI